MSLRILRVLRRLPTRASPLLAASLMQTDASASLGAHSTQGHSKHSAPDDSIVLQCPPNTALYKLEGIALALRSPSYPWSGTGDVVPREEHEGAPVIRLPGALGIAPAELEALLDVLASDPKEALPPDTPFARLAGLLRVSDPTRLDVPDVHTRAQSLLEKKFTSGPHELLKEEQHEEAEEALALALRYGVTSIQKGLFYTFITTSHFEEETQDAAPSTPSSPPSAPARKPSLLTPADLVRCTELQTKMLENFAPTLFQAPPGAHMACSDALADAWLTSVIPAALTPAPATAPALVTATEAETADLAPTSDHATGKDGTPEPDVGKGTEVPLALDLGRPLEALHALERADWTAHGVCASCTADRRADWRAEREAIWAAMDGWLGL